MLGLCTRYRPGIPGNRILQSTNSDELAPFLDNFKYTLEGPCRRQRDIVIVKFCCITECFTENVRQVSAARKMLEELL